MEMLAMLAAMAALFVSGYCLGQQGPRRSVDVEDVTEEDKRAQERLAQGLASIMGYDGPRGLGDD